MLSPVATYWLAVVAFVTLAATTFAAIRRNARASGFDPRQYPLYLFGYVLTRVLWRARVVGKLELPHDRGALIVCNHRGPVDPAFIALACKRQVHWMVAKEYFAVPIFGGWLRLLKAIPTRRGGIDTEAVKQTIRAAKAGGLVGVFPEGKINATSELILPLRSGAVMIALEARVPVVPCYIERSPFDAKLFYGFLWKPAKTKLVVGRAIDLTEYYDRADDRNVWDEITLRIGREIAKLAGRPDYEPQLVSRNRRNSSAAESTVERSASPPTPNTVQSGSPGDTSVPARGTSAVDE